jgi:oligoendopeptidase F
MKSKRSFLPENLKIKAWSDLAIYFNELNARIINTENDFKKLLFDVSELQAVIDEDLAWRYIKMTIDTTKKELSDDYSLFVTEIQPNIAPESDLLNKKILTLSALSKENTNAFAIYLKNIKKEIEIYREENIALISEIQSESQRYGAIAGQMNIEYKGETITLQKASQELKNTDRKIREEVYHLVKNKRIADKEKLNDLFTKLTELRNKVALNAGFKNYRDYKFVELGRFDYNVNDCFDFHNSIKRQIKPIANQLLQERKNALGLEHLKPWDLAVDTSGKLPLKPFATGKDLIEKSISVFTKVDPYFGECLVTMQKMGHLDLESKNGKAPGGYNYPLAETGVPFIFMNAVGSQSDMVTMMHEGGHAIHSFLSENLEITAYKNCPMEVAELASMSMELITMEYWDEFYTDKKELERAKKDQLQGLLSILPWIAIVDKFQHWIYENPTHSFTERELKWKEIYTDLSDDVVDWDGEQDALLNMWQKQLHIYEVPFYYIEYGMAQLGAIAVWKNYKENPKMAIENFKKALSLGYTENIKTIYKTAGIAFDFSENYIETLTTFINKVIKELNS